MANPFEGVNQTLRGLIAQRQSPQFAQQQANFALQNQSIQQQQMLSSYLASADLSATNPSEILRTITAITGNPEMVPALAKQLATENAFQQQQQQLRALQDVTSGVVQESKEPGSLGGENITQQEIAERAPRILGTGAPGAKEVVEGLSRLEGDQFDRAFKLKALQLENDLNRAKLSQDAGKVDDAKVKLTLAVKSDIENLKPVKQFREMRDALAVVESSVKKLLDPNRQPGSGLFLEQAAIVAFNKVLDPGSVVRESEFDRSAELRALKERAIAWEERITGGKQGIALNDRDLRELVTTVKDMAEAKRQILEEKTLVPYQNIARRNNLASDELFDQSFFDPVEINIGQPVQQTEKTVPTQQTAPVGGMTKEQRLERLRQINANR